MTARSSALRYALGVLLAFAALNAFGGGYYGMAGAKGVPRSWLSGSPFASYFVPGVILFVVVGGAFLAASVAVFAGLRSARRAAFAAAFLVLVWLAVQLAIIGYVSWMQPVTAGAAVVIALLAWFLPPAPTPRPA
jgi:hypothetical protein